MLFVSFYIYCLYVFLVCFFFFKQKTAYEMRISDWSSDVCSSDLRQPVVEESQVELARLEDLRDPAVEVLRRGIVARFRMPPGTGELRAVLGLQKSDQCHLPPVVPSRMPGCPRQPGPSRARRSRSEEHTSELHSPMRHSHAD